MLKSINNISSTVLIITLGVVLVILPSYTDGDLIQPTQTGKFFFFAYALVVLFIVYGFQQITTDSTPKTFNLVDLLLCLLLVWILINRYFIQDYASHSIRFYELIGLSVLYINFRSIKKEYHFFLLFFIIGGAIIQAIIGNLQLYGYTFSHHSGFKMTGSFFNPGPYAGYLAISGVMALGVYLYRQKLVNTPFAKTKGTKVIRIIIEYLSLACLLAIALVLPALRSRAAWLAVLAPGLYIAYNYYNGRERIIRYLNKQWKKVAALSLVTALMLVGAYGLYHYKKGSADGRMLIWKVTSAMIAEYPITGVGFDRFKVHYMNYQADWFKNHPDSDEELVADNVNYAFNELLQLMSEQGLVGLLLVLILLFTLFRQSHHNILIVLVAKAGLMSTLVFSFFSYPSQILPIKLIAVIMLSIIAGQFQLKTYTWRLIRLQNRKVQLTFYSGVFTSLIGILIFTGKQVVAINNGYVQWRQAFNTYQYGLYEESVKEYEKVYGLFKQEGDFLQNYGKALQMAGQHEKAIEVLTHAQEHLNTTVIQTAIGDSYKELGKFDKAAYAYTQALYMIPGRFYARYLMAKLYHAQGDKEKAIKIANELLHMQPKINSTAIEEIKEEMRELLKGT